MFDKNIFDFFWINILPASNDQIFGSANNFQVAIFIQGTQIASRVPTLGINNFGSFFGIIPITGENAVATNFNFANFIAADGILLPVVVYFC